MPDSLTATVVVASNRAAAGIYPDRSGPILIAALRDWGFAVGEPVVVGDGDPVGRAIAAAIGAGTGTGTDVVLTSGGTGVSPTDRTPEVTAPLLDRELPGIVAAIRARGVATGVPSAVISRGLAGVAGRSVVVNLPGSPGGVRDGLAVLKPVLGHLVGQVRGGDHVR